MNKQKHKAFTLVELIIVVKILAILGAISFVSFKGYTKNTRDSNRLSTLKTIEKGLSLYNIGAGKYPKPNGELSTGIIESKELTYVGEIGEEIQRIIKSNKLPKDPLTGNNYIYGTTLDYKNYEIATILESDIISQSILFKKAYAGNTDNIKSKVDGDYPGYIKYSSGTNVYLANIPSIIFNNTGSVDLLSTGTYYIRNKGKNLPYGVNGTKKSEDIQKINAEALMREITNYPSATLQTVNITEILNKTKNVEEVFTGGVEKSFNIKGIDSNNTKRLIEEIETIIEGKSTSKEEVVVTNGNCGASDGKYMIQKPTTGLCNTGTPTTVNGTGPWTWSCESPDTGTSTSCTTNKLGEVSEGTHTTTQTGIVWNYTIPTGAIRVEISLDGSTWIDNSLNTSYSETSLTCGTSYTGRKLRACDTNGYCTTGITLSSTSTNSCPTNGIVTYNSGRRWSNGTYAASCNSYRNPSSGYSYSGDIGDGQYYIDPDGSSGNPEFLVYCDMTTDGGGWTRISYNQTTQKNYDRYRNCKNNGYYFETNFECIHPNKFTTIKFTRAGYSNVLFNSSGLTWNDVCGDGCRVGWSFGSYYTMRDHEMGSGIYNVGRWGGSSGSFQNDIIVWGK